MNQKPIDLFVSGVAWEKALRGLSQAGQFAVGPMRVIEQSLCQEYLVDHLELTPQIPAGIDRPPLTDWVVLTALPAINETSAQELLHQIQPRKSQAFAVLVFSTNDRSLWTGLLSHEGVTHPIANVKIVGRGMLHLNEQTTEGDGDTAPWLDTQSLDRGSRTMGALGEAITRRIRKTHVVLIGCGRSGALASWHFVGLGVPRLTLVDPDHLELHNLDGMPAFTTTDVGRAKVDILAKRLLNSQTNLALKCIQAPAQEVMDQLRVRPDLIVTCVDDDTPRLAASMLSRELLAPHLDIATSIQAQGDGRSHTADIRLLLPFAGCVDCVGGLANRDVALYNFAAPIGSLYHGEPPIWDQQRAGSLIHWNSIAVGTGIQLWLSLLNGDCGSFWQRLNWDSIRGVLAHGMVVRPVNLCNFCLERK